MSIPLRHSDPNNAIAGARTFFVTSSTWGKRQTLQSDRAADLFVEVLYHYRALNKFRLHEFVVMHDHFHLLLTVDECMTIERAVQFVKGGFAFRAARELRLSTPFWQKGFSEIRMRDGVAFRKAAEYICNNPVVAGLVREPGEFKHSSAHAGYELDAAPAWMNVQHWPRSA